MKYSVGSFLILSLGIIMSLPTYAHEGHDHGPKLAQAPHGGVLQSGKKIVIEVIQEGGELKIYPLTLSMKAVNLADITIKATYELPKKKSEILSLKGDGDFFVAKVDSQGAHRFQLNLNIDYENSKEKLSFQIEPDQD